MAKAITIQTLWSSCADPDRLIAGLKYFSTPSRLYPLSIPHVCRSRTVSIPHPTICEGASRYTRDALPFIWNQPWEIDTMRPTTQLRQLLAREGAVIAPGVADALNARLV